MKFVMEDINIPIENDIFTAKSSQKVIASTQYFEFMKYYSNQILIFN